MHFFFNLIIFISKQTSPKDTDSNKNKNKKKKKKKKKVKYILCWL